MEALLTILAMALVTFAIRFGPVLLLSRDLPPLVSRWLHYVPVAIFAALVVPGLLLTGQEAGIGPGLCAGLAGLLVAWRTRNTLLVIVVGMATYWLFRIAGA